MKQNLEFIAQLNIIAIVSKAIRIIDKCYKDECEQRNLAKDRELLDYTPFPEKCNYDEFYTIVELRHVASPLIVADMISAYYMDSSYDNTYLLKLLTEKLDLEFDTESEYRYYRRFVDDHDFNICLERLMLNVLLNICQSCVNALNLLLVWIFTPLTSQSVSSRLIEQCYLRKVYDYVCDDAFKGISFKEFERCVVERNFSKIYNSEYAKASMIKYLIYVLSKHIDNESWYRDTAHSINTEPQKCSGASVPKQWRREWKVSRFSIPQIVAISLR